MYFIFLCQTAHALLEARKSSVKTAPMKNILLLTAILTGILFPFAIARAETLYGLAMHGAPKYERGFDHLDYANPDAPKGGHLKMTAIGTFDNLNPYAIKGKAAQGLNLYYDRLMARVWDEPFTMYPLIAESVEIPEDRSAITVHINPAARFHDGSPVTADDVIFSFETLRDHGRPNMRSIYRLVKTAEKRDDLTVHFAFGEGYDQETVMILAMMPVLSKSWWQEKSFDSTTLTPPLSNGPYRISEVNPGRSITYERVEDYWAANLAVNKGHYNFDKITYFYFRDDMVAFEAFKAGNADLRRENSAALWARQYDFPAVKKGDVITAEIEHGRPERVRALIFNTRRPPLTTATSGKPCQTFLILNGLTRISSTANTTGSQAFTRTRNSPRQPRRTKRKSLCWNHGAMICRRKFSQRPLPRPLVKTVAK